MKVKVTTGAGFRGLVNYQTKPGASFISSSTGKEPSDFLRQAAMLRSSRPDVGKPVLHFSLSQPVGEPLSDEQWQEATEHFLQEMGLEEFDFFCVRHSDADHDHVHIAVSKIHPTGKLWNDSHSARRGMAACEKIEVSMGLTKTKTLAEFREETGLRRNQIKDRELQMMKRTGEVGSRRKAAIAAKIAAERKQNGTENRPAATDRKASRSGAGLAAHKTGAGKALWKTAGAGVNSGKVLGKIRVSSYGNRKGEVVFKIDNQQVARLTADRQSIEVFILNEQAIDFAIQQAVKSGQVPLQIYGTPEFIIAAEALAKARGVPVATRFPELGSGHQPLTPPTQGVANAEYRELQITDRVEYRSKTPPTAGGRVRTLSEIHVVQRGRAEVFLPRDARSHLNKLRTHPDQQMRRLNDQGDDMKTDVDLAEFAAQKKKINSDYIPNLEELRAIDKKLVAAERAKMQPDMNSPDFKRMESMIEERRSQLPPPIQTPAKTAPKTVSESQYIEAPRPTSAPAPRPKF